MAKFEILVASTSVTVNVFIRDSSSTTGAGLTGLAFNTSNLVAYYALPRAAAVAITLATLAAVTSAYSSGGFKEIDATNMPGWYRLDIPNAALASGRFVDIQLQGATNMAQTPIEIELTAVDNQNAVRMGMTALPNAAANAAGGLPISIAGALDLDEMNTDIEAIEAFGAPPSAAANAAALLAAALTVHDTTAITTSTVNDALLAARSQGGGAWTIVSTALTLKNPDGTTFRTFTLDSGSAPTSRT